MVIANQNGFEFEFETNEHLNDNSNNSNNNLSQNNEKRIDRQLSSTSSTSSSSFTSFSSSYSSLSSSLSSTISSFSIINLNSNKLQQQQRQYNNQIIHPHNHLQQPQHDQYYHQYQKSKWNLMNGWKKFKKRKLKQQQQKCQKNRKCFTASNPSLASGFTSSSDSSKASSSSKSLPSSSICKNIIEPSFIIRFLCYFDYFILILFGYFRMILEWFNWKNYNLIHDNRQDYRPLYNNWQAFFTRYVYRRVADIFSIPITGNPGGFITVLERKSFDNNFTFKLTGNRYENCINLASYDYLGFSSSSSNELKCFIEFIIRKYGITINSTHDIGKLNLLNDLEKLFAKFLNVEDCIIFGMGFATNSLNIPLLADRNSLIIADERSHASAKCGIYLSNSTFQYFKHNDCDDLEKKIRLAILNGNQKNKGKPFNKIIIIVEGVYSMEGTIVNLPRIVELKRKYKCYIYIDEAHSIGAIGPNGRGICDYFNLNPNDIDLLMGTMTKSFAAAGGYIGGRKSIIDYIRCYSMSLYAGSISPPIIQQIINTVEILSNSKNKIMDQNDDGQRRIRQLLFNTHYMRDELNRLGFVLSGHYDSPVIPIMIYLPSKIGSIVRMSIKNGLALVCAGYPATSLTTNRIRLCMTAAHTKETLDRAIRILNHIGDIHHIKYRKYGIL